MKKQLIIIVSIILFIAFGCSDKSNEVVVYTSVDQIFSEPILKDFEKETGIKVKAIYDTEETKSTGVLNRLIAEKNNPQCDLFWSGDPIRTIVLKNKGITAPYQSPSAKGINEIYKDPEHQWTGFSARARVLIYNKDLLDKSEVPQSIFDLTKKEYKGKVAIANPLFGTTTFHISALFTLLGDEKAKQFLTDLKNNDIVIATSNGDVKKRVVQGEVACGLTDTDDAYEAIKEGANIGIVFLDQKGIGSLIMPNTVCLIKNSPNGENGKKLMDHLLSKATEAKLAISCGQMPLHKGVKIQDNIISLDNIVPMKIDYDKASVKLEEIQNYLKKWSEK
ncbi:Ferric iron ABC transporter, iron-binding protein [hydrothermal vent metagenome]|uniref:Ferric iron ABC transporter, iron-binding protein n=1 Tax=hydrothermal vent metagenome TaxID=652676 RepID=A0A3B1CAZ2_9ZZZZ